MAHTIETITQMREHYDKARERLEVCGLGSFPGLKMQKQDAYLLLCDHMFPLMKKMKQRRLLKAKKITGEILLRYL